MSKHTPWKVNGSEDTQAIWVEDSQGKRVATIRNCDEDLDRANLIASAPELLAELHEQDKFLGVLAGTVPLSEKDTHRRIAIHRESVRAAIAKATGSAA